MVGRPFGWPVFKEQKGDWSEWNWIEYVVACQMSVGFAQQECGVEPKLWCAWKDCGCKIGKLVDT